MKPPKHNPTHKIYFPGIIFAILLALSACTGNAPAPATIGEVVTIMADTKHVQDGTDPGPYNTNPPTSGRHYATPADPGFYEAGDLPGAFPEGYLVHSLEHGYVIFWYNCDLLDEQTCSGMKDEIRNLMESQKDFKLIAYPWNTIDSPVVMTSWGRLLRFDEFDAKLAKQYIDRYRNRAPEPNAP